MSHKRPEPEPDADFAPPSPSDDPEFAEYTAEEQGYDGGDAGSGGAVGGGFIPEAGGFIVEGAGGASGLNECGTCGTLGYDENFFKAVACMCKVSVRKSEFEAMHKDRSKEHVFAD
jgi:hypothetical protein